MAERAITAVEVQAVVTEFFRRLVWRNVQQEGRPFLLVVGGAPGSGKSTVASYIARMTGAVHIQSNSARFLLAEKRLPWGENVHRVIQLILETLLKDGWSVVLDGMLLDEDERKIIEGLAQKYNALLAFSVVICAPQIAEARAQTRYEHKKPSSFEDWRCNPEKFEDYILSIYQRTKLVDKLLATTKDKITIVDNSGPVSEARKLADPIWFKMEVRSKLQ